MLLYRILQRDLLLATRQRAEVSQPLLFFVIVVSLFALTVTDISQLMPLTAGIIWVTILLATLLSLENLFRSDFDDGSLEQYALSTQPLALLVFAKLFANYLIIGLPLIVLAALSALLMHFSFHAIFILMLSLLIGIPTLNIIGAIAAALIVGLSRGGILLALLVLPLYVPVLIFGVLAVSNALVGMPANAELALLGALLILAVALGPITIASALRVGLS